MSANACLGRRRITLAVVVCVIGFTSLVWGQSEPLGDDTHPPRPELTGEDKIHVEELEKRIDELRKEGRYDEAIGLAEEILAIRRERQTGWTNGDGEPAEWYEVGDARRAVEHLRLLASLGPEQRAELDEAHTAEASVSELYGQGNYAQALEAAKRRLDAFRRILGSDHADTLRSANWVGFLLHHQDKLADAEDCYRDVLNGRLRILGKDHPNTLNSIDNMGNLLRDQGKVAEAEFYFREAMEGFRRVLGSDHVDTLASINSMGVLLVTQGKLGAAERYCREALVGYRRRLGDNDPGTLTLINNMGFLLRSQGRLAEAEAHYREALNGRLRVLGDDHPQVLNSINSMGAVLEAQGNLAEAEAHYRKALEGHRRVLGSDHRWTLSSANNVGHLLEIQGRLAEAEPYYRESLEGCRRELGDDHRDTLVSIANMASLLQAQGKRGAAERFCRDALEGCRRVLGDNHTETLLSINNMGHLLKSQGRLEEAESYYREALAGSRRVLGNDHPHTLTLTANMGSLLQAQGKLAKAERYCREALEGRRRVLGDGHPDTLTSISNTSSLLSAQGKLAEAELYYCEALALAERLRTRIIGEERGRAAYAGELGLSGIAAQLASVLIQMGRPEEAWSMAERGRSRALLDLLSRSDQDVIQQARARAEQAQDLTVTERLETALGREQEAKVDLTAAEALLTSTQKQRKHTEGRDDVSVDEKAARLAKLDQQVAEQAEAVKSKRRALADAVANVHIQLRGLFPDAQAMAIEQIRAGLDAGGLALGYSWTGEFVLLLSAPPAGHGEVHGLVLAKSEDEVKELDELVSQVRDSIANRSAASLNAEALDRLFDKLISDAIRPQIEAADRLIILPDGPLHGVPFEVLALSGEASSRLPSLDTKQIVYAGSATMYLNRRATAEQKSFTGAPPLVALGNPIFDRDAPPEPDYPEQGVLVLNVTPDSNAAEAGLTRGDVLLSYGGMDLPNTEAVGPAITAVSQAVESGDRTADEPVDVTFWCDGQTKKTSLLPGRMGVQPGRGNPAEGLRSMARAARGIEKAKAGISATDQVRLFGGRLRQLPGTGHEAAAIARIVRSAGGEATLLVGEDATISKLSESVEGGRYLHLATHGLTGNSERPYDASLALTQPKEPTSEDTGFLRLEDLIRTWGGKLKDCELVVLSACDTQRGIRRGTGIMALPWGFMYAGAPTVVASLWQVDDVSTAILMEEFYQNMLQRGMPIARALREAKLTLRNMTRVEVERRLKAMGIADWSGSVRSRAGKAEVLKSTDRPFEHPYYWAPFVVIGAG